MDVLSRIVQGLRMCRGDYNIIIIIIIITYFDRGVLSDAILSSIAVYAAARARPEIRDEKKILKNASPA